MKSTSMRLSLREKIGYGFGDLASVLYWQTFMLYFTYFYTDVFLIPASIAATMFLVSRLWDGINDPLMGIIADRTNTRWGKFRPYLLWMCIPFAVVGVLAFTVPNFGMSGKIIWAYATFVLIMMMYTAINIPYTSLLGVISGDSNERTTVSSVKFLFAFAAGIIVSATLLPMAKSLGSGDESIIKAEIKDQRLLINEVDNGNARIILTAEDTQGNKGQMEFNFRVNPADNNMPEINKPVNDLYLTQGFQQHEVDISEVFAGREQELFDYSVENKNNKIVDVKLNNGKLLITEKNAGSSKIILKAKDKKWGEKTHTFYVNVAKEGNNNPVIKDSTVFIKLQNGFGKKEIDLTRYFSDPDGDALSFETESNNRMVASPVVTDSKLSFIEGKPGLARIKVTAIDHKGGLLIHNLNILVATKDNNPPYVNNLIENAVVTAGFGTVDINISDSFVEAEGEPLKYEIEVIKEAKGWQLSFVIYGIAAVIFFLIAFKSTKERVQPPKAQETSIGRDLRNLVTNRPWLILLATTITFILFVAVRGSVTVHYFKYVIGTQQLQLPFLGSKTYDFVTLTSAYNTIGQMSSFLGVLLVAWFAKLIGKKKAFVVLFIIAIFSTGIIYFLTAKELGLIFFFQITGSMTGGPLSVLIWAMYADTADYGEWKKGTRSTGLVFSASTMAQKFGWAFGAFVALTLMSQLGFQPDEVQSSQSLNGLLLLFSLIPAGMGALSILLSMIYPLNDKRVQEIENELIERRKQRGEN
ncbi:MAG: MFS transporter [Bacteroidales bacterium]|nr:MFS transporter [Bacteroidales bacterium]